MDRLSHVLMYARCNYHRRKNPNAGVTPETIQRSSRTVLDEFQPVSQGKLRACKLFAEIRCVA